MGQHVKARVRNESRGQLVQKVAVQNGQGGLEPPVHQGVFGLPVGQHRKIRHLRPGAGGGGNGGQGRIRAAEIGHGLGAVHGAAAPQGNQQVRAEGLEPGGAPGRQFYAGVWLHAVKNLPAFRTGGPDHPVCHAVFHKEGVCHQKHPPGLLLPQHPNGPGAGDNFGIQLKFFHPSTAFSWRQYFRNMESYAFRMENGSFFARNTALHPFSGENG